MEISVKQQGGVVIVRPVGEIDALTASSFAAVLNQQLQAGGKQLVIDLEQVEFMSSAGLRVLLMVLKELRRQQGNLRLAAVRDKVLQILQMSGFSTIFQLFPTVEDATASFR